MFVTLFEFHDAEWALLDGLPDEQIAAVAAELDLIPAAEIDRRALLAECVPLLLARAKVTGLPLSKYDREDIEALPSEYRAALAVLLQVQGSPSVDAILRAGERAYQKHYARRGDDNAIAMILPMLLVPIARAAFQAVLR